MCGITGVIGKNANHSLLSSMVQRIAHRGPDGQGVWQNEDVSLGHLRLSIIDLTNRADQPMHCAISGNVVVFNGEIYNYKELRDELRPNYPFKTDSDTEVILAAFHCWGIDFLQKLRGMFAIALFEKSSGRVLIVRDRLGIKPFYYRISESGFYFSSEIKGLLNLPNFPKHHYKESKILQFLSFRQLDTDCDTFFEEIKQLPQAGFCWVDANGQMSAITTFWKLPKSGNRPFGEAEKQLFRDKFLETVGLHLRSDVQVGSFLSGGLDSTSIACAAWQLLGKDYGLHTFSSVLKEKNEENALISVAQDYLKGHYAHDIEITGAELLTELPKIIYHHDEPLPDASMYIHYQLCKLARDAGIKVLLSGNGGDEVLGGYASHIYSMLGRRFSSGKWLGLGQQIGQYAQNRHESVAHLAMRSVQESLPFSLRNRLKKREASSMLRYLKGNFSTKTVENYPFQPRDAWQANYENHMSAWTVPPFLHYEDRNSMSFGVEIRVPMLDHEFVELMASFQPEALVDGRSKHILRDSLRGLVPDSVLDQRGKYGFPAPLEVYTQDKKEVWLKNYLEQIENVPFLDQQTAIQIGRDFWEKGQTDLLHTVWRIYSLSVWHNQFFS
jgi:asparagine synthase (glutamine-hydrolysing)